MIHVVEYCVLRQAYENPVSRCDTILCAMSDGTISEETRHPAEHWPYSDWFRSATTLSRGEFLQKHKVNRT